MANPAETAPEAAARLPAAPDSAELAGDLVRDLVVLAERETTLAASRHLSLLRRSRVDLLRLACAIVVLAIVAAALAWAAVRGLDTVLPLWASPLVLALALLPLALLLLPRGALRRLRRQLRIDGDASDYQQARDEAEQQLRSTSHALATALAHQQEALLLHGAEREVAGVAHRAHTVETSIKREIEHALDGDSDIGADLQTGSALAELVEILTLPTRASINILSRLLGTTKHPADQNRPPRT